MMIFFHFLPSSHQEHLQRKRLLPQNDRLISCTTTSSMINMSLVFVCLVTFLSVLVTSERLLSLPEKAPLWPVRKDQESHSVSLSICQANPFSWPSHDKMQLWSKLGRNSLPPVFQKCHDRWRVIKNHKDFEHGLIYLKKNIQYKKATQDNKLKDEGRLAECQTWRLTS